MDVNIINNGELLIGSVSKVLNEVDEELPNMYFVLLYLNGKPLSVLYNATEDYLYVQDTCACKTLFSAKRNKESNGYDIKDVKYDTQSPSVQAASRIRKLVLCAMNGCPV